MFFYEQMRMQHLKKLYHILSKISLGNIYFFVWVKKQETGKRHDVRNWDGGGCKGKDESFEGVDFFPLLRCKRDGKWKEIEKFVVIQGDL